MSESETSSLSEASESTIEVVPYDKALDVLKSATKDVLESNDYLSYITVLDIYLNTPSRYSYEERENILEYILGVLNENTELCYEIAWDLPSLLLLYVESDYDFSASIRDAPCVYRVIKLFECLAKNGNSKELFLRCCEILSSLNFNDITTTEVEERKEKFFEIKLYCIFELIDSSLKKIETYYPSRFLSMFISSFINLIHQNCSTSLSNGAFILKRVFSFARNYNSLPTPVEEKSIFTEEEIKKIKDDEDYLQRKLLTSFLTQSVTMIGKYEKFGYAVDIFSYFHELRRDKSKEFNEFRVDLPVLDRLAELASSFDINLDKAFKEFMVQSHVLFHKFDYSKDIDGLAGEIFEKLIIDYQQNLEYTLVNSDAKEIRDSKVGYLILYTHHLASQRDFESIQVSFYDAIVLTVRLTVPGMVQTSFMYSAIHDLVVYWSWYAIHQSNLNEKNIQLEITRIPKTLLMIYYQVLLYICGVNTPFQYFRNSCLTLLTKVLSLSPESFSYEFILDSLKDCPYENIRPILIGILKDLLTKKRSQSLVESMQKVNISGDETEEKKNAPPLPSRDKSEISSRYILLTKERASSILKLILSSIDHTFIKNEGFYSIDQGKVSTLSAFLNLAIIIKQDPNVSKDQIEPIISAMELRISNFRASRKNCEEKSIEDNQIDILKLVVDRIKQ